MRIVIQELTYCGPRCPHYWIWSDGPCCSENPGQRIPIPEEFDKKKGFPEFCNLKEKEKKQ